MTSTKNGTTEFRFYRPDAKDVKIVGDFTGWCASPIAMLPAGDGWWTATAPIAAGEYRFRYIADEQWYTDFAAQGVEASKMGWNSVLVVSGRAKPLLGTPARQVA